jgi:hypothetical protein
MSLCRLTDLPLPGERSSRFTPVPSIQEPAAAERLQYDHEWIGQLQFSTCLHPDARDYFVRLANIFSLGAIYYPLYTVASQLSLFALELALRTRFRFETRAMAGLRELLDHATERKLLLFEQTETVRVIHRHEIEMADYGFPFREPREIAEIARNRGNLLRHTLPDIRNFAAHPDIAGLDNPAMAYSALEHALELANIVYEESEGSLKGFVSAVEVRMDEIEIFERTMGAGHRRYAGPLTDGIVTKRDACSAIEKAARSLGVHRKASIAFNALRGLGLVPNAAQPASDLFRDSFGVDDHLTAELIEACTALLANLAEAENRLPRVLMLEHQHQRFIAKFVRIGNSHKWVLGSGKSVALLPCELDMGELSYYSFLKAGLALSDRSATHEIRGLSSILGQRPDAYRWEKLNVAGDD